MKMLRLQWLNGQLEGKEYLCGKRFTLADILLYCWIDFGNEDRVGQPLDPANTKAIAGMARLYLSTGDADQARQVLDMHPRPPVHGRGVLPGEQGDTAHTTTFSPLPVRVRLNSAARTPPATARA